MINFRIIKQFVIVGFVTFRVGLILLPSAGQSQTEHKHDPNQQCCAQKDTANQISPAQEYFTDVVLIDQDGEKKKLYSDLLKGKVVIINSFFASCRGTCPVMLATFVKLQDRLGNRLGKDVHLISLSVDPETDTPSKLKALAEQLKAKPGWHFLTGTRQNVDWALYKFGQYVEAKESHSNIFIVGNESTGLWRKAFGLASAEGIFQILDEVLRDEG